MSKPLSDTGSDTDLLQCPYEVSHLIMRKRFQAHLARCCRSHPKEGKIICPFNVSHRLTNEELECHILTCPERQYFEHFCTKSAPDVGLASSRAITSCETDSTDITTNLELVPIRQPVELHSSELWSDDVDVPSYNPHTYAQEADVLRMPVGLTRSQRNAFRLAERKRLESLAK